VTEVRWKIHKFGGSSLADAKCFERVTDIVLQQPGDRLGVVVSAAAGTTDRLLRLATMAEQDNRAFLAELDEVVAHYAGTARSLLNGDALTSLLDRLSADTDDLQVTLKAIARQKSATERHRAVVSGYGELWSAQLLAAVVAKKCADGRAGGWIDARQFITVRASELGPSVLWEESKRKCGQVLQDDFSGVVVITGFIAADEDGLQTTLGRNGSDHSAAIVAALTDAEELSIWTDVDGVMSADPRKVPEARVIEQLSYNEAMELAYFGASVIHPHTLGPVVAKRIPVVIRNTFNVNHGGSRIQAHTDANEQIKGITAIGELALVNLEGAGMIGVPGTADRLFAALKGAGVSVTLISQASSEHSICVAVPHELAERAKNVISDAFADELAGGQIQSVDVTGAQSIVAVVGDGMAGSPGIAAKFFGNLGRAGINIRAIAQGSSERNISAVVDSADVTRALRAAHSGFYLSSKTLSIGLIGPGIVGGALLDQIARRHQALQADFNLDLRVRAIARSNRMLLGERQIDLADWQSALSGSQTELEFERFEQHVHAEHLPHAVIVDCSASDEVAARYAGWLKRGINVVTPNKKAFSGAQPYYEELRVGARLGNTHYLYETTVGAALPIIKTIRDLIDTGDEIHSVQGIFSGTLAYLFNVYDGSKPFSAIVSEARRSGYTEPDPRDDLSGMDVARKLTILAQFTGVGDFPVENLVPEELRELALAQYLERLADNDDAMRELHANAQQENKVLRYVARLRAGGEASVGLEMVEQSHPFANINLTDNIVQFVTARYADNPLVVQGPGAGPEVTAGGVFGDLLRLAAYLGDGASA